MGSLVMMAVINFETAIYWGQLSRCKPIFHHLAQYSCDDTTAYGSVSAFAVLVMLCQLAIAYAIFVWRMEFIDESGIYDEINASNSTGTGVNAYPASSSSPDPSGAAGVGQKQYNNR